MRIKTIAIAWPFSLLRSASFRQAFAQILRMNVQHFREKKTCVNQMRIYMVNLLLNYQDDIFLLTIYRISTNLELHLRGCFSPGDIKLSLEVKP
jgi:hypothetical protein